LAGAVKFRQACRAEKSAVAVFTFRARAALHVLAFCAEELIAHTALNAFGVIRSREDVTTAVVGRGASVCRLGTADLDLTQAIYGQCMETPKARLARRTIEVHRRDASQGEREQWISSGSRIEQANS